MTRGDVDFGMNDATPGCGWIPVIPQPAADQTAVIVAQRAACLTTDGSPRYGTRQYKIEFQPLLTMVVQPMQRHVGGRESSSL